MLWVVHAHNVFLRWPFCLLNWDNQAVYFPPLHSDLAPKNLTSLRFLELLLPFEASSATPIALVLDALLIVVRPSACRHYADWPNR